MAIKRPIVSEIGKDLYLVNEYGLVCMYIICGEKSALVIDTGMGYYNFLSIIRELTSLPFTVACTHGSIDHTGGWDLFDEVYIHPATVEGARKIRNPEFYERKKSDGDVLRGMCGDPDVWEYTYDNIRIWENPDPAIKELYDGLVFDLGGRKVTTVYTPAHNPGHCCFIDDKTRIMISGDCCSSSPTINRGYVSQELHSLYNIKKHDSEFDRNFDGHVCHASDITVISQPKVTIDDGIELCKALLNGTAHPFKRKEHLFGHIFTSAIHGSVRFNYSPDRLWEPNEQQHREFPSLINEG